MYFQSFEDCLHKPLTRHVGHLDKSVGTHIMLTGLITSHSEKLEVMVFVHDLDL